MQTEKRTLKYFFSTEGETEVWYLKRLEELINSSPNSTCKVSFCIRKDSPRSFVKKLSILNKVDIFHFFDVESVEPEYEKRFIGVLDNMKLAEKFGKNIKYISVYTNLTFELWIILHKMDCNGCVSDRKKYLSYINKIFNTNYEALKEYKEEKHFKQILNQISIEDVKNAVLRADKIMQENIRRGYTLNKHNNYSWYKENPSTEAGNVIAKILNDCGLA